MLLKRSEMTNYISLGSNLISNIARFIVEWLVLCLSLLKRCAHAQGRPQPAGAGVSDGVRCILRLSAQRARPWARHLFLICPQSLFVILPLLLLCPETLHSFFVRAGRWSEEDCSCSFWSKVAKRGAVHCHICGWLLQLIGPGKLQPPGQPMELRQS